MGAEFSGVVYCVVESVDGPDGAAWWSPLRGPDNAPHAYRDMYTAKYIAAALRRAGHECMVVPVDTRAEEPNF